MTTRAVSADTFKTCASVNGAVYFANGDAVAMVAGRLEVSAEAEGAAFHNGKVALMNDRAQLAAVVGAIS